MATLELHGRALRRFGDLVHSVGADQWHAPTPCTEWDVRQLVDHLVVEQLWVPAMVAGRTVQEIGDEFEGDLLGDDPVAAWDRASAAAGAALAEPGALRRTVHLSYGDRSAEYYCAEMTADLVVHSWDLARAIGADEKLDPELVDFTYELIAPQVDALAHTGLFAPPVEVPPDADEQTRLLALSGRRP
ncbi:MAG TPA: TIGR03086 family metal-binding protein [Pseudonocardiaceae bacterium]|jgi:uncharacterized protein (TIGR03086 family)